MATTAEKTYESVVDPKAVGKGLAATREEQNLEPTQVKDRVGITAQRLAKIEEGRDDFTVIEAGLLAAAYGYTPQGLIGRALKLGSK